MKADHRESLASRKARLDARLVNEDRRDRGAVFASTNERYEVSERTTATCFGGIALIHRMVKSIGLCDEIDNSVKILKTHCPYHESDHVLNMAYNVMVGHRRIEDLEILRQDEAYMNAIGARRIPDPTTAGDFLRRFNSDAVDRLAEAFNIVRVRLWKRQCPAFRALALIDIDGTIVPTLGEKKEGCDFSYKGDFGYAPLVVSLANTNEVLYVHNRSGNRPSHEESFEFLRPTVELVREAGFRKVRLRGDTDFSLTETLGHWDKRSVEFVFGMDANRKLVDLAKSLPAADWHTLERPCTPEAEQPRARRENVKDKVIRERGFRKLHLDWEDWAEFSYRPLKCDRDYRMVVVRKTITVSQGEDLLFPETRYHFYITNVDGAELSGPEIVFQSSARCNQENVIEQLKNGVNAMISPSHTLVSNGAYMLIAALAWNLKAWLALSDHKAPEARDILRMEFRRFVNSFIRLPCQVLRTGRRLIVRLLAWAHRAEYIIDAHERLRTAYAP